MKFIQKCRVAEIDYDASEEIAQNQRLLHQKS